MYIFGKIKQLLGVFTVERCYADCKILVRVAHTGVTLKDEKPLKFHPLADLDRMRRGIPYSACREKIR